MSEVHHGARPANGRALNRVANDFQSDAAAIEEAPVPITAHAALYLVLLLLIVAVAWAIIGTVDRIVVGSGKIASRTPMLVMQPFTTSRVVQIDVKAGDHVKKGQILARFDQAFAQADVSTLQQKVRSLTAQTQRLSAELSGAPFTAAVGDDADRITQAQIYAQEMNDYQAETGQRDSRLAEIQSQMQVDQDGIPGIQSQLAMANKVVAIQEYLQREKAAATLDVMKAQSGAIDSSQRLRNTEGDLKKLTQQRAEATQEPPGCRQ